MVGGIKYRFDDLRNSLERSSARETTMRVAVGAVAKRLLAELDMEIANHIVVFGGKEIDVPENLTVAEIKQRASQSEVLLSTKNENRKLRTILTKSSVTVIPSVGLWRQSSEVFQLVLVPMSNGTENWMHDWPKQLFLSMPLRVWSLVLVLSRPS